MRYDGWTEMLSYFIHAVASKSYRYTQITKVNQLINISVRTTKKEPNQCTLDLNPGQAIPQKGPVLELHAFYLRISCMYIIACLVPALHCIF